MNISIRLENENDFINVENMTREAFWDVYKPGCDEHLVVHKIRKTNAFIQELDFVACDEEIIVGNVIYTKAKVINENNQEFEILCMGPLDVVPSYQGKGIGTLLMKHSIKVAKTLGYNAIAIFGNPNYYHRFGFINAKEYGIQTSRGENFEEFMALELCDSALNGISGRFYEDEVFEVEKEELEIFEKEFPYKEKHVTETQLINNKLMNLGFSERIIKEAYQYKDLFLGRVVVQYKDLYKIAIENSELIAEISGKLRYYSEKLSDYPAVGDFVMIDRNSNLSGNAIIHHILTRRSIFVRRVAGTANDVQVVATNIDTVFICMSLNNDFNLRRLERYLAIAWDSGAKPVIVLTKSDLCEELSIKLSEIREVAVGVNIIVTSSIKDDEYKPILKYITAGQTVAFIGSSGVGKSSLINCLLGENIIGTGEIRKDDKGKHTTTRRELLVIPSGGAVIDTPGMREMGVESINLAKAFSDIDELASRCKFNDCQHEKEPGCEVIRAIAEGLITKERLISYNKLKREAKYDGLNSKEIEKEKIDNMYSSFDGIKNARNYIKSKSKRR